MWRSIGATILGIALTFPAAAAVYEYHPRTAFRLGGGLDPNAPFQTFRSCVDFTEKPIENTSTGTVVRGSLVQSRHDLLTILNISASLSGRYAIFGGSGSFSLDDQYSFHSDSLVWVIYGFNDFGRYTFAPGDHLYPEFQKMIDDKRYDDFADACGKEIITEERKYVQIAAIFQIHNLSEEKKRDLQARASFSAGGGLWSAEAQASYRNFVSEASKYSAIDVSIVAVGGPGISNFAAVVGDLGNLQTITTTLQQYVAQFGPENAVPMIYTSGSMRAYGWKGRISDLSVQDEALGDLYLIWQDARSTRDRMDNMLRSISDGDFPIDLSQSDLDYLKSTRTAYQAAIDKIVDRADRCRTDEKSCKNVADINLPTVRWFDLQPISRVTLVSSPFAHGCGSGSLPIMPPTRLCLDLDLAVAGRWDKVSASPTIIAHSEGTDFKGRVVSLQETAACQLTNPVPLASVLQVEGHMDGPQSNTFTELPVKQQLGIPPLADVTKYSVRTIHCPSTEFGDPFGSLKLKALQLRFTTISGRVINWPVTIE